MQGIGLACSTAALARPVFMHGDQAKLGKAPHDGVLAALRAGAGFVELKLHDDLGDLELWVTDPTGKPLDLPAGTVPSVIFLAREPIYNLVENRYKYQEVELRVRNSDGNEDEDDVPNMRPGLLTNYFIGPSGEGPDAPDATWLTGVDFCAVVEVRIALEAETKVSTRFKLVPHGLPETNVAISQEQEHRLAEIESKLNALRQALESRL
jgi:hypothetical protein